MYDEAKVNTVLIRMENDEAVHENAQADNHSCSISTPAMDHKNALMRTTTGVEQARKAKTTPFSVSLAIATMMCHEA